MAGTKAGGKAAAETNKRIYGEDFYARIALRSVDGWRKGGCKPRGFAAVDPEKRREAGRKGGRISKRGKARKE